MVTLICQFISMLIAFSNNKLNSILANGFVLVKHLFETFFGMVGTRNFYWKLFNSSTYFFAFNDLTENGRCLIFLRIKLQKLDVSIVFLIINKTINIRGGIHLIKSLINHKNHSKLKQILKWVPPENTSLWFSNKFFKTLVLYNLLMKFRLLKI